MGHGWIFTCIECRSNESWLVGGTYIDKGDSSTEFVKVLKSSDKELPSGRRVVGLCVSPDGHLAIALQDCIHVFSLVPPLGPADAQIVPFKQIMEPLGSISNIGWIAGVFERCSIALCLKGPKSDTVLVYGSLMGAIRYKNNVMQTPAGAIHLFSASEPGHVAVVHGQGNERDLHMLCYDSMSNKFVQMNVELGKTTIKRPAALAMGDKLTVVGYAYPPDSVTVGLVEVYRMGERVVVTQRSIPASIPTALATNGSRVLVGVSRCPDAPRDAEFESTLYAFSVTASDNFAICKCGVEHDTWHPGSIALSSAALCYARNITSPETGDTYSIVEHAVVAAR